MEKEIPDRLTTLGHPQRLALFRLLMRRYPDSLPAGEIGQALGLKASTLSAYLSALQGVDLITQRRAGTSLLYAINMAGVRQTFEYLLLDCCRGRPDLCATFPDLLTEGATPMADRKYNVLFICTGNSARSIFAETLLREMGVDRFNVFSAGTRPQSELNPFAVRLLEEKGHDVTLLRAKNVSEFTGPDARASERCCAIVELLYAAGIAGAVVDTHREFVGATGGARG